MHAKGQPVTGLPVQLNMGSSLDPERETAARYQETPLAKRQLIAIFLTQLHEGTQVGLPYLIAVYMVRDWLGPQSSEETVGRMTGLLAASFCGAQFFSSIFWGYISDRYGRKGLVTLSNVSSLISVIVFGLAPSYWVAFAARSLGGLFNSTFLNVKAMIGEFTDDTNQGTAMSYLGVSVGLGCVVAPVLGGSFARPCSTFGPSFPFCGPDEFFQVRPFFLPCLAVAVLSVLATLSSIFLLQETLPRIVAQRQRSPGRRDPYQQLKGNDLELAMRSKEDSGAAGQNLSFPGNASLSDGGKDVGLDSKPAGVNLMVESSTENPPSQFAAFNEASVQHLTSAEEHLEADDSIPLLDTGQSGKLQSAAEPGAPHQTPWYRRRQVLLTLSGYGMVAFSYNLLDELLPLYASAPVRLGGLLLPANLLAVPLMTSGPVMIIFSIWILPPLQRTLSILTTMRVSLLVAAPLVLVVPFASFVASRTGPTLAVLTAAYCCIRPVSTAVFTCSMVLVNTAGPRSELGAVNALGQMIAAFVRALGPFLGGLLWGATLALLSRGHEFVCFSLVACCFLSMQFIYAAVRQ